LSWYNSYGHINIRGLPTSYWTMNHRSSSAKAFETTGVLQNRGQIPLIHLLHSLETSKPISTLRHRATDSEITDPCPNVFDLYDHGILL
jgi:hypothetical protein